MTKALMTFCLVVAAGHAQSAPQVVEIGIASNFSEISSSSSNPYGNYFRQGIELAIKHHQNDLKNKNIKIKLREFDYGTSQMRAVKVANDACKSNVSLVLGYVYSSDALLAAPIHQKCGLPLFSPSATANRLGEFNSYVHLGAFSNKFQGVTLAQIAKEKLKAKRTLVIYAEDCAYCTDLAQAFEEDFSDGTRITEKISILSTETNFTSLADKVRSFNADVILVPNHELLSSRIIAALATEGIRKPFLGGDGWGNHGEQFAKILHGRQIDGFSISHWFPNNPHPKSKRFVSEYRKHFNKVPNDTAVLSYDSMSIVIKALLNAKNTERNSIEHYLQNLKRFDGVTGKFDYANSNAPKKDMVLLKAGQEAYRFIKVVKAN